MIGRVVRPATGPAKSRSRRKQSRPAEILAAALEEFAKNGFAATRMGDVAARAGVSKGVVYLYFDSKAAIFEALIRTGVLPNIERMEGLIDQAGVGGEEGLRAAFAFIRQRFESSQLPVLPRIVLAEAVAHPQFAVLYRTQVLDRAIAAFTRAIERGVASGEFRAVDPYEAARLLINPMWGVVMRRSLYDFDFDIGAHLDAHLDLFLHGVVAAPKARKASGRARASSARTRAASAATRKRRG